MNWSSFGSPDTEKILLNCNKVQPWPIKVVRELEQLPCEGRQRDRAGSVWGREGFGGTW